MSALLPPACLALPGTLTHSPIASQSPSSCRCTRRSASSRSSPSTRSTCTTLLSTSSCSPKPVSFRFASMPFQASSLTARIDTDSQCKHCKVRWNQQQKYLKEAYELYGEVRSSPSSRDTGLRAASLIDERSLRRQDFHIVRMPLLSQEVRGTEALKKCVISPAFPSPILEFCTLTTSHTSPSGSASSSSSRTRRVRLSTCHEAAVLLFSCPAATQYPCRAVPRPCS